MTNTETLFTYRLRQADETLQDIDNLIASHSSGLSIVNRSYYAMFYAVLALFIRLEISHKSSKHSGVIATFDKEIVHNGLIGVSFSSNTPPNFRGSSKTGLQGYGCALA